MLLDIVILPPAGLRQKIGLAVKKAVNGLPYDFVVDNSKLIPHLSLYHLRVKSSRLKIVEAEIKNIAENFKAFKVKSVMFGPYEAEPTIYFHLSKPKILQALNKVVVARCQKFRAGLLFARYKNKSKYSAKDNAYIKKYGTPWSVEKNFKPHLTMLKLKNIRDVKKVTQAIKNKRFEFTANTLAICKINVKGQVYKIIKKFNLK